MYENIPAVNITRIGTPTKSNGFLLLAYPIAPKTISPTYMQYETVDPGPKSAVICGFIIAANGSAAGSQNTEHENSNPKISALHFHEKSEIFF